MLVPIRKKWKKMLWGKVDQSSSVQKNQAEITWYNSRSWWATDAVGLTGSRSLKPCPSPCWTGDGRPHSYQCNSTVKGEKPLRMRQRMSVWHRQPCQQRADVAFLSIRCTFYESPLHCKVITTPPPTTTTIPTTTTTTTPPDRHHCARAHRDKIPLIHVVSGELKQCKQPTWGWISAMKGTLPLVLLSLWASNNTRGELIMWKKLRLWTQKEGRENTWPRCALALEMARALKSEKFMLLNFQKVSIMCPCSLSLSGEDVLMAVTSKTEAWQKHYLRLSLSFK